MNKADLVIRNAVVVSPHNNTCADIVVKDGVIQALVCPGTEWESEKVVDAGGRYVMPGCVDGHTHMMDPGMAEREEFATGTAAAAAGGTTTIIDHHRNIPPSYSLEELREKIDYLMDKGSCDFSFDGGVSPDNTANLEAMWNEGVTAFKTFTCNLHGVKAMYSGFLLRAQKEIARLGGTMLIHCEDDGICAFNEEYLKEQGRTDSYSQYEWRSKLAERVAAMTVIEIAKETGCRTIIAHVSQPEILEEIRKAREEGYEIYAESCPHYFHLNDQDLITKGPWVKFTPPMNTEENRLKLWKMFDQGYVATIGSDHCPWLVESKLPGEKNIWDAPNGIPGVETSLRLMLDGVNSGYTTLNRLVECMCEKPAKLYGLFPKKGRIAPGADADFVILDMDRKMEIRNEDLVAKCKWSPFDGKVVQGVPHQVFLRGELVAEDGKFLGRRGYGQFVKRLDCCRK